ncbi:MAG: SDR family NAD(P)-dependent oxidoreductase [Pseudomonadota bacterium]
MEAESAAKSARTGGGRSVLITGCSSGIGAAAAAALRERGWRVFASCRAEEDCARLLEDGFESPRLDYKDEASVAEGFSEVLEATGGRLDALFNNGAYAIPGAVEDLPTDALRDIFEANLFGWHTLTRLALPVMRAQGSGRIVQCSSVLGMAALKFRGSYIATKFALEGLTDTLRLEVAGSGVEVILIEPGPIGTAFHLNAHRQMQRWISAPGSPHRADYQRVTARLTRADGETNRFELPPEAVVAKLIRALESPRPAPRYFVTTPTYVLAYARRALSTRALDRLLARISD